MSTMTKLHFSGSDPSDGERANLDAIYRDYVAAAEEERDADRLDAAIDLIEALMRYAEVSETEAEQCDECEEEATEFWPNLKTPVQLCDSCGYNARRSGWEPGR